ncbi:probable basic-leucine zipper transcription factor N isoform X1 [Diprion similis]|uniref:probable basic-leucine zipper transcription factor N isoform X1 n=1 Tax=Diprion similis TaxID=362088 RepID=UPI001EF8C1CC|nr:probable basic-leucine zipper transcription factor N isoform X1 [Diprion similis]
METLAWSFTLITVALLLDPTFADVLVQPGYTQQSVASSKSQAMNGEQKNQQMTGQPQSQQNYAAEAQNLLLQLLQHQHMLQKQHLNNIHQYEQKQLLQMQQQQLQHPMVQRQKVMNNDQMVSMMPFGLSPYSPLISGLGDMTTGRLFSMGPMGLNTFTMGGLRPPLLMSPQQTQKMSGSAQFQKSSNGLQDQTRSKREIRDVAPVESGPKKFRQSKNSRQQMDGMAANPSVKPKSDNNAVSSLQQNSQSPSKSNDDRIVGDVRKMNDDTVAGPLDDFIETLKNSGLVNPLMDLLNGGGVLPQSNFLGKSESGIPQFEEHIVSQPHQQQQQLGDQNPMMSMLGHHHNPPYTSYGHHHPHHLPTHYGSRPTKYYPYRNMASGSSSLPMNEGGSIPFQDNQGQAFWAGSPHQVQPGTSSSSNSNSAVPESVSKASNPAAKFVKDPVIKFSMSQRKNEDPVIVAPNPNSSKAAKPSETPKPIASESPMNPAPIESQPMMPVQGAIGKQRVLGSQYPMNMVPQTMIKMMSPYNSMMRSMSPMVGAPSPTDQLSGLLYTLADQLSTFGNGGGQYAATNDRYQNYREANFGLGDLLDRGYGSYPGQLSYGTIPGIGYDESPYSTFGGYNTPYQYHQHSHSF